MNFINSKKSIYTFLFILLQSPFFLNLSSASGSRLTFNCQGVYHPQSLDEGSFSFHLEFGFEHVTWSGQWRPGHSLVPYSVGGTMQIQSLERPGGNWLFLSNSLANRHYISFHSSPRELTQVGPHNLNPGREVFVDIGTFADSLEASNSAPMRQLLPEIRAQCSRSAQDFE